LGGAQTMAIDKVLITKADELKAKHQNEHDGYEYFKKIILSKK
jgi:hypothetical protein